MAVLAALILMPICAVVGFAIGDENMGWSCIGLFVLALAYAASLGSEARDQAKNPDSDV